MVFIRHPVIMSTSIEFTTGKCGKENVIADGFRYSLDKRRTTATIEMRDTWLWLRDAMEDSGPALQWGDATSISNKHSGENSTALTLHLIRHQKVLPANWSHTLCSGWRPWSWLRLGHAEAHYPQRHGWLRPLLQVYMYGHSCMKRPVSSLWSEVSFDLLHLDLRSGSTLTPSGRNLSMPTTTISAMTSMISCWLSLLLCFDLEIDVLIMIVIYIQFDW